MDLTCFIPIFEARFNSFFNISSFIIILENKENNVERAADAVVYISRRKHLKEVGIYLSAARASQFSPISQMLLKNIYNNNADRYCKE